MFRKTPAAVPRLPDIRIEAELNDIRRLRRDAEQAENEVRGWRDKAARWRDNARPGQPFPEAAQHMTQGLEAQAAFAGACPETTRAVIAQKLDSLGDNAL